MCNHEPALYRKMLNVILDSHCIYLIVLHFEKQKFIVDSNKSLFCMQLFFEEKGYFNIATLQME